MGADASGSEPGVRGAAGGVRGGRRSRRAPGRALGPGAGLGLALAGLVVLGLGYAVFQALWAPEVAFLTPRAPARWIVPPLRPSTQIRGADSVGLEAAFRTRFALDAAPGPVELRLRAFRAFRLVVNGREVAARPSDRGWKSPVALPIGPLLERGPNEIRVEVRTPYGPPALWLATRGLEPEVRSGSDWSVSVRGGPALPARVADDTRPFPTSYAGPRPAEALGERGPLLLGAWLAATAGFALLGRSGGSAARWLRAHPDEAVLVVALLAWGGLVAHNFGRASLQLGFDAPSHLSYVRHLLEHRALPATNRATYHVFENHQPPLFYTLSALVLAGARALTDPRTAEYALRAIPALSGLGQIAVAYAAARVLLPGAPVARAAAVGFVALTPVNLYMAHYVSNEPLSALLIGAALALGAWLLVRERPGVRGFVALGAVGGLALMTKATFAGLLPLLLALLAWKLWWRDRLGPAAVAGRLGVLLALAVPLGGWFYLRSWIAFGTPLVLPWEGRMGVEWWQDPGYHTPGWFLAFGRVFELPFFAGTYSFLDSLYATFWGDGFLGGRPGFGSSHMPPWDFELMAALYLLAVPASLLMALGAMRGVVRVVREASAAWLWVLGAVFLSGLSLVLMNLRIPYYAQAKAFYALGATVPLGLLGGAGLDRVDAWLARRGAALPRAALRGYLVALGFAVAATFYST